VENAMGRSDAFHRLRRAIRLALQSDRAAVTPPDHHDRRRFLGGIAAGIATTVLAPLATPILRARAAPRASGSVAIVGAGLAGLACAEALATGGIAATLFEGSTRVGGRCFSLSGLFPGQVAERGGEFIDTGHGAMRRYANAFGLPLEDVSKSPGEVLYFINGQRHGEQEVVDEFRAFVPAMHADLRRLGRPTAGDFTEDDRQLDLTSLTEYLDTRGATPLLRAVVDVAYITEYGREIAEQSCVNFLLFIHADRRSKFHPFGIFSDERFHVVEGNQGFPDALAERLPGEIFFSHVLVGARRQPDGRIRLVFDAGGQTVESDWDAVVLAVPFSTLRGVALDASLELPPQKQFAIDHLVYGTNNPLARGSYTCNQPGYFTTIAGNEAPPVGNLFFAGEHTSSFYEQQGFMEGAAPSGQRAAGEVYRLLRG